LYLKIRFVSLGGSLESKSIQGGWLSRANIDAKAFASFLDNDTNYRFLRGGDILETIERRPSE
jgi:hypothetical protein